MNTDDLPVLSWETMALIQLLVTLVLFERWADGVGIAEKLDEILSYPPEIDS